jgi:hypothetical protein
MIKQDKPQAASMIYPIRKTEAVSRLDLSWDNPAWAGAEVLEVRHFRPEGSEHRPHTRARLLYDAHGLHGIFQVHDRFVRCVRTEYHSEVWKDSCVEFFAEPKRDAGYFNFEFNCGGAFLCSHIVDPTRTPNGFAQFTKVPADLGRWIQVRASLPRVVDPEITDPVVWTLQFHIPFKLFEMYVGPLGAVAGQAWRGNFYKCADDGSHPHWGSWSPVDEFNFHLPRCFGTLGFES